eukprot:12921651-Prorocentrum_lima.AAC.1
MSFRAQLLLRKTSGSTVNIRENLPKAIRGLRRSGAAGLDGWRPAHIRVLAKDTALLTVLQDVAEQCLQGKAPEETYEWLNTAR